MLLPLYPGLYLLYKNGVSRDIYIKDVFLFFSLVSFPYNFCLYLAAAMTFKANTQRGCN